jgi:hypothetical protein
LIPNYINQDIWEHLSIQVGNDQIVSVSGDRPNITADIEWGLSKSQFGYSIMERDDMTGDYEVTFYFLDEDTKEVSKYENKSLPIPKGPRASYDDDDETVPPAAPTEGDPTISGTPSWTHNPYKGFGLGMVTVVLASIISFGFGLVNLY